MFFLIKNTGYFLFKNEFSWLYTSYLDHKQKHFVLVLQIISHKIESKNIFDYIKILTQSGMIGFIRIPATQKDIPWKKVNDFPQRIHKTSK